MMHGDLVYTLEILKAIIKDPRSVMTVSSTAPLPKKDFKSVIKNNNIQKVGIDFFEDAMMAQPLYKINKKDWEIWLSSIVEFCEHDNVKCYAENAFNAVSNQCIIYPFDIKNELCSEIDDLDDLKNISVKLKQYKLGEK